MSHNWEFPNENKTRKQNDAGTRTERCSSVSCKTRDS